MSVITVDQAKLYMRMDLTYTLEDELIEDMIKTAEQWCEAYTGLAFAFKDLTKFAKNTRTELTAPVNSITSVLGVGGALVEYIYADEVIYLNCGSSGLVSYKAGYKAGELPEPIKSAVKMLVSTLYENREDYVIGERSQTLIKSPIGVTDLLRPYSRVGGLFL